MKRKAFCLLIPMLLLALLLGGGMAFADDPFPESAHPYANSEDRTWSYTYPASAYSLDVTFSADTEVEENYDFVSVLIPASDGKTTEIGKYTGKELAGKTINIPGNAFQIRLTSDTSKALNGFTVISIESNFPHDNPSRFCDKTWSWTEPGADAVAIVFSDDTNLGTGTKTNPVYLEITDSVHSSPQRFYGEDLKDKIVIVDGNSVALRYYRRFISAEPPQAGFAVEDIVPLKKTSGFYFARNTIYKYLGDAQIVTVPAQLDHQAVLHIEQNAFENCTALTALVISDSVSSIGKSAFKGCEALQEIQLPKGLREIMEETFSGTTALQEIVFPDSLETIDPTAFDNCAAILYASVGSDCAKALGKLGLSFQDPSSQGSSRGLNLQYFGDTELHLISIDPDPDTKTRVVTIPEGVTLITSTAFDNNRGIADVIFPSTLKTIESSAFNTCLRLTSIELPEGLTTIGENAFKECINLVSISIPSTVTDIGANAFERCEELTTLELLGGSNIGTSAFIKCNKLTTVKLHGGSSTIGASAFQNCTKLTTVELHDGLTTIGANAFQGCTSLESFILPYTVTDIGASAFQNCKNLHWITIPYTVTNIGENAFKDCSNYFRIRSYLGTQAELYALNNGIRFDKLDDKPKHIEPDLTLTFPLDCTSIGEEAFMGLSASRILLQGGDENDVDGDVGMEIGPRAFADCKNLEQIYIPENVLSISPDAFSGTKLVLVFGKTGSEADHFAYIYGLGFVPEPDE